MTKQSNTRTETDSKNTAVDATKAAASKAADTTSSATAKIANDTNTMAESTASAVSSAADETLQTATKLAKDATTATNEMAERAVAGVRDASAKAAAMTADTQKSLGENIEKFSVQMHGLSAFGQQNLEAFSQASEISAKALEHFGEEVADYTKKTHEDRIAAVQDFTSAKSMAELIEKQMAFAQHAFDGWAHQAIRMSEIFTSSAKEAAAPLGARVSAMTEDMKTMAR